MGHDERYLTFRPEPRPFLAPTTPGGTTEKASAAGGDNKSQAIGKKQAIPQKRGESP